MKKILLFPLMIVALMMFSCNSGENSNATTNSDSTKVDSAAQTNQAKADTMMNNGNPSDTSTSAVPTKPKVPQLSFCDCVKKQDTLKKAMMNAETTKEIKAIQAKMKALVKGPCSKLLSNQISRDQVAARKAKVAACLGK